MKPGLSSFDANPVRHAMVQPPIRDLLARVGGPSHRLVYGSPILCVEVEPPRHNGDHFFVEWWTGVGVLLVIPMIKPPWLSYVFL